MDNSHNHNLPHNIQTPNFSLNSVSKIPQDIITNKVITNVTDQSTQSNEYDIITAIAIDVGCFCECV